MSAASIGEGSIGRRACLLGMLAAGATSAMAASPATSDAGAAVTGDGWSLDDLIRVIGRNDGAIAVRWTDGVMTAHVDSVTTPLLRVMSQIFSRHRRRDDGGYDTVVFELAYFVDLQTRELLESWVNPLTGVTVAVPKTILGPTPFVITPKREAIRDLKFSGGAPFSHRYTIDAQGSDFWLTESLDSVMPSPAPGVPGFGFHENFVYHASAAELRSSSKVHVEAIVQKSNVLSFRPWMLMGDRRGTTVTRAHGKVIDDMSLLPKAFRDLNAGHGNGLLDDLEGVLRLP